MFGSLGEGVVDFFALAGMLLVNGHLFVRIKPIQRIKDVLDEINPKAKPKADVESQTVGETQATQETEQAPSNTPLVKT